MKLAAYMGLTALLILISGCDHPQPAPLPETKSSAAEAASHSEADDTLAIEAHPDMVKREGDSLLLFVAGKPVARTHNIRTKDCEGFDSCFDWKFEGVVTVREAPDGPLVTLPVIRSTNWENMDYVIIDALGRTQWLSDVPLASADGCSLIYGHSQDLISDGYLAVIDWCRGYPRAKQAAFPPCEPKKWTTPDTVELACRLEDESDDTLAQAQRLANGTWLITPPKARLDMIAQENLRLKPAENPVVPAEGSRTYGIETLKP